MGHIDDPADQIESQYPIEAGSILTPILAIAAPFLAVEPKAAAIAAVVGGIGVVADFLSRRRVDERMNVFFRSVREQLRESAVTAPKVHAEMSDPSAQETIITATVQTLRTPNKEKIQRFGKVVGSALNSEAPDWQRATEFVRDLEQLNDHDLAALRVLWGIQRGHEDGRGRMHTDANRYTGEWSRVVGRAGQKMGWHPDELYSRCARLSGFGLAIEVQPNPAHQGPDDHCFRLTGKGVELLRMLQSKPDEPPEPDFDLLVIGPKR